MPAILGSRRTAVRARSRRSITPSSSRSSAPENSYGQRGTWELTYSATFAILAASRNFVVQGEDRNYQWRGGFEAVERAWGKLGAELVITCQDTAETLPEHKMAVLLGRNRPLWNGLHKIVKEYLTRRRRSARRLEAEIARLRQLADQAAGTHSAT